MPGAMRRAFFFAGCLQFNRLETAAFFVCTAAISRFNTIWVCRPRRRPTPSTMIRIPPRCRSGSVTPTSQPQGSTIDDGHGRRIVRRSGQNTDPKSALVRPVCARVTSFMLDERGGRGEGTRPSRTDHLPATEGCGHEVTDKDSDTALTEDTHRVDDGQPLDVGEHSGSRRGDGKGWSSSLVAQVRTPAFFAEARICRSSFLRVLHFSTPSAFPRAAA